MEWFEAILLGLIQGLTEFLPVSSSGHLEIGKVLLGVETTEDLLFTTMVHAATVLSTVVVFRHQIWDILKGFFCGLKGLNVKDGKLVCNDQTDYLLKMVVSMIRIFIVGVFFKDQVEVLFGSIKVVGYALLATSVLLVFSDLASRRPVREGAPAYGSGTWSGMCCDSGSVPLGHYDFFRTYMWRETRGHGSVLFPDGARPYSWRDFP